MGVHRSKSRKRSERYEQMEDQAKSKSSSNLEPVKGTAQNDDRGHEQAGEREEEGKGRQAMTHMRYPME